MILYIYTIGFIVSFHTLLYLSANKHFPLGYIPVFLVASLGSWLTFIIILLFLRNDKERNQRKSIPSL